MSLSIANRILLGFAAALVLLIAVGVIALVQIADVRDTMEGVVSRNVDAMSRIATVRDAVNRAQDDRESVVAGFFQARLGQTPASSAPISGAPGTVDATARWRDSSAAAVQQLGQAVSLAERLNSQAVSPERAAAWRKLADALAATGTSLATLTAVGERQVVAAGAGDLPAVTAAGAALDPARLDVARRLRDADGLMQATIDVGQARISGVYEQSRQWIIVALAIAALLGIATALGVRRSIAGPLGGVAAFVERVGHGELDGRMDERGPTELSRLGRTLNGMVEGLRTLARQSREATGDLNAAAAEIRASTQQQAASVEEQLAAVQETAATVDEITHAGAQIGKRAQEVIASAQATVQTSTAGLKAVDDTARAMDLIRDQAEAVAETVVSLSEKTAAIEAIITSVNEISERSHLLALNAAIEAAGAGESGQRFAVVAAEMKTLADQAKDATSEVRQILGDIQRGINTSVMLTEEAVKRVAAGKARTDITQSTIEEITARIQESVQTFQQIVASTNQQQLGIEQVMGALQNIRQASQQTAAGTRQLEQAAGNLSGLAQALVGLVERYRL